MLCSSSAVDACHGHERHSDGGVHSADHEVPHCRKEGDGDDGGHDDGYDGGHDDGDADADDECMVMMMAMTMMMLMMMMAMVMMMMMMMMVKPHGSQQ